MLAIKAKCLEIEVISFKDLAAYEKRIAKIIEYIRFDQIDISLRKSRNVLELINYLRSLVVFDCSKNTSDKKNVH